MFIVRVGDAWAAAGPYTDRHDCYAGVGEATIYVERDSRGAGVGKTLLNALADGGRVNDRRFAR
jgi:L-amino acid N-acyltransferase YncA